MDDAVHTAARGAFLFAAVFLAGLMAGGLVYGSHAAFVAGLMAAGASYLAQICEAYRSMGVRNMAMPMLGLWLAALCLSVFGLVAIIGA